MEESEVQVERVEIEGETLDNTGRLGYNADEVVRRRIDLVSGEGYEDLVCGDGNVRKCGSLEG